MASHSERPTIDLAAGRVVLEADLPRVLASLGVEALEELGWRRPDGRTLLVPISGELGGQQEEYLLSLCFLTGRDWPPSAQFVNPETLDYVIPDDFHHLPIVETPELQVHTKYQSQHGKTLQLICSSATFDTRNHDTAALSDSPVGADNDATTTRVTHVATCPAASVVVNVTSVSPQG